MYAREKDIFHAIYCQLKVCVSEHYITDLQHKQQIQQFNDKIFELIQSSKATGTNAMEQYIRGEVSTETLRVALDVAHDAKSQFAKLSGEKTAYEKSITYSASFCLPAISASHSARLLTTLIKSK